MAASQTSVEAYHTHRRGNPLPHPEYNTTLQRNTCFAHAIIRKIPSNTDASDQMMGAYSGFQASPGQEPSLLLLHSCSGTK